MKLLHCHNCKDVIAVTPWFRKCLCGKSKAIYYASIHKEVYSGPAVLLGINDDDLISLKDHMDVNGFFKSVWVTISPASSTILKVKDAAIWKPKILKEGLTRRQSGRKMASSAPKRG